MLPKTCRRPWALSGYSALTSMSQTRCRPRCVCGPPSHTLPACCPQPHPVCLRIRPSSDTRGSRPPTGRRLRGLRAHRAEALPLRTVGRGLASLACFLQIIRKTTRWQVQHVLSSEGPQPVSRGARGASQGCSHRRRSEASSQARRGPLPSGRCWGTQSSEASFPGGSRLPSAPSVCVVAPLPAHCCFHPRSHAGQPHRPRGSSHPRPC